MVTALPRVVIAAPASGHGKTTVATGLMAALVTAGHRVSAHKIGPDYIDPGYHALATGRPGRNLDPHLVGTELLVPLLLHGAATPVPADIAIVEGVMGLFDGAIGRDGFASTAHVAGIIGAPVILVVDISSSSRTIAAVVHGLATFDPAVRIAGVILNKAGSQRHATEVRQALEVIGMPVLGVLHRDDGISAPSRHLGLVPVAERADARHALDRLAAQIAERIDLAEVVRIAGTAADLAEAAWDPRHAALPAGYRCTHGPEPVDRDRRRTGVHLPLSRDRRVARGGGLPDRGVRPGRRRVPARRYLRDLPRRRLPRGARRRPGRQRRDAGVVVPGHRCRRADGRRMRGAAVPVPNGRRCADGRRHRRNGRDGSAADAELPHGDRRRAIRCWPRRVSGHRARIPPHHRVSRGRTGGRRLAARRRTRRASASTLPGPGPPPCMRPTCTRTGPGIRCWRPGSRRRRGRARETAPSPAASGPGPACSSTPPSTCCHHGDRDIADHLVDFAVNVRVPAPPDWLGAGHHATTSDARQLPATGGGHHRRRPAAPAAGRSGAAHRRRRRGVHPAGPGAEPGAGGGGASAVHRTGGGPANGGPRRAPGDPDCRRRVRARTRS